MSYYKKSKTNDMFDQLKVYIPVKTMDILKQASYDLEVPLSRLVAMALDNELDSTEPFNYPCELPTTDYVEYAYASEAGKLLAMMQLLPQGIALDSIMLARRDIGVPDRKVVMLAVRELLEKKLVEFYKPKRTSFNYHKDYVRLRVIGLDGKVIRKKGYKRMEGEILKGKRVIKDGMVEQE